MYLAPDHLGSKVNDRLYCCLISSATVCSGHAGEERDRAVSFVGDAVGIWRSWPVVVAHSIPE